MNIKQFKHPTILFVDSGIGGLSTLSETLCLVSANFIYFADNKYAPYGTKSDLFLQNRLTSIISKSSEKHDVSAVVLACNTATTSSIKFLRKTFPHLDIVGTEPAYKVALDKQFKSPAVLATPCTISHLSTMENKDFHFIPDPNLASNIENFYLYDTPKDRLNLLRNLYQIKNLVKTNDCLVLGCTHYVLIKSKLSKLLNIPIIDGNHGVAKQVFRVFNKNISQNHSIKIKLSKNNSSCLQKYKKILRQILAKQINLC